MDTSQGIKSITIQRKIIRADGTEEPEEVVCYWDRDPDMMRQVLAAGGSMMVQDDGTIIPAAQDIRAAQPSDQLLAMTREELEGGRP